MYNLVLAFISLDAKVDESVIRGTRLYSFRIQDINGIALLWGDQLRQQYIVDAYVAVEQNCLRYLHLNQRKLRADLYQGL
ncbi:unnamed protein product [Sphagnum jensenii]|uniref:Helitron helicase-like domain-containing protein n=1 Tax=Sphagnum jensenii TaxID=128206 RepID=A0ABP1AUT5_9BRYO